MQKKDLLPNFLCVGASKTGTSSMYQILKQHNNIFLPEEKELNFFHKNYNKGIGWYINFYQNAQENELIGEICPTYIYNSDSPLRIFQHLGKDVKLIFIFRNPADKMFSNYKMNLTLFNEKNSFKKAVELDEKRIQNNENYNVAFHYIKKGYYDEQLLRYLKYFDTKNMLFLIYEKDFKQNTKLTYKKILDFLNVKQIDLFTDVKVIPGQQIKNKKIDKLLNTSNQLNQFMKKMIYNKKRRIAIKAFVTKFNKKKILVDNSQLEELRPYLINDIYKDSILNLEKLINKDLSIWYNI